MIDQKDVANVLRSAIVDVGYRRIDCAPVYFNEAAIGDALYDIIIGDDSNGIRREDLYIVSKLASPFHRDVETAVRKTLLDLRLDYLDLFLIHWPVAFKPVPIPQDVRGWENEDIDESDDGARIDTSVSIHETWKAMEELCVKGLVRDIGVSNFPLALLHELMTKATIPPVLNQVELHPYLQQPKLLTYCRKRGIQLQAYSPLGTAGYKEPHEPMVLHDPVLKDIAAKMAVTPAQVSLAWAWQRGTTLVVKSSNPKRLAENAAAESISLSDEDMERINLLDRQYRFFRPEDWWGTAGLALFD